jgi:hypothetical protein
MSSLDTIFQSKFDEFCTDLEGACPELKADLDRARKLSVADKLRRFRNEVKPDPRRDGSKCPGCVLPGVILRPAVWDDLSEGSKKAIQEYLTLLTMCSLAEDSSHFQNVMDISGGTEFLKGFLDQWKERLASTDFSGLASKFGKFFEGGFSAGGAGGPGGLPSSLPERFLKGHIAKLAEDLVKEFKAEDFGLSTEDLLECERNPTKAFELLLQAYTGNPQVLQNAMKKIANKMQQKIQRGELRPQDLANEAEELIRECTDNPAFREMMESMRDAFGGMEGFDNPRAHQSSARLSLARQRLNKAWEKKYGNKQEKK